MFAQEEKIQSDRPGESQTVSLTEKRHLQAEIGFRKEQQNKTDYSIFYPRMQLKYGLSGHIELRAEFTEEKDRWLLENEFNQGLKPVELGLKAKLWEQKGALPALSFFTLVGHSQLGFQ